MAQTGMCAPWWCTSMWPQLSQTEKPLLKRHVCLHLGLCLERSLSVRHAHGRPPGSGLPLIDIKVAATVRTNQGVDVWLA